MFKSISDLPVIAVEQWHPADPMSVKMLKRHPDVGFDHDALVRVRDVAVLVGNITRNPSSIEVKDGWSDMTAQMKLRALVKESGRGITELDPEACDAMSEARAIAVGDIGPLYPMYHSTCGGEAFLVTEIPRRGEVLDSSKARHLDGRPQQAFTAIICDSCNQPCSMATLTAQAPDSSPSGPQTEPVSETQDPEPALYDLVHIGCGGVAFRYSKQLAVGDAIHPSEVTMVDGGSGLDSRGGHLLCGSCGDLLVAHHVRARGAGWMGVTLPIPSTPAAGEPNPGGQLRSDG